jgi:hypothetical protein
LGHSHISVTLRLLALPIPVLPAGAPAGPRIDSHQHSSFRPDSPAIPAAVATETDIYPTYTSVVKQLGFCTVGIDYSTRLAAIVLGTFRQRETVDNRNRRACLKNGHAHYLLTVPVNWMRGDCALVVV